MTKLFRDMTDKEKQEHFARLSEKMKNEPYRHICGNCGQRSGLELGKSSLSFESVLKTLDAYTAKPRDGDYDAHITKAMEAVYRYLSGYYLTKIIAIETEIKNM